VLRVPRGDAQARGVVEVELPAGAVKRQPAVDADLAAVDGDAEAPDDAVAVEPGVVQPLLAVVEALLDLEVVDAEQHAEVEPERRIRIGRQRAAVAGAAVGEGVRDRGVERRHRSS